MDIKQEISKWKKQTKTIPRIVSALTIEPFILCYDTPILLLILLIVSVFAYILGKYFLMLLFILAALTWYTSFYMNYYKKSFMFKMILAKAEMVQEINAAINKFNKAVWND